MRRRAAGYFPRVSVAKICASPPPVQKLVYAPANSNRSCVCDKNGIRN